MVGWIVWIIFLGYEMVDFRVFIGTTAMEDEIWAGCFDLGDSTSEATFIGVEKVLLLVLVEGTFDLTDKAVAWSSILFEYESELLRIVCLTEVIGLFVEGGV